jgi:hypothetical protein
MPSPEPLRPLSAVLTIWILTSLSVQPSPVFVVDALNTKTKTQYTVTMRTPYSRVVLLDRPEGYWPLDDPSNQKMVRDVTGRGHHGSITHFNYFSLNQPSLLPGKRGRSVRFTCPVGQGAPGINCGRILIPAFNRGGATGWTQEFWVRITWNPATAGGAGIYSILGDDLAWATPVGFRFFSQTWRIHKEPTLYDVPGSQYWAVGKAAHVAVVYERAAGFLKIYLNGILAGSTTVASSAYTYHNSILTIGGNSISNPVQMFVDEVAWYLYPLSQAQVMAHYRAGGTTTMTFSHSITVSQSMTDTAYVPTITTRYGRMVLTDGPEAYWPLDDPAGSRRIRDVTGNGHDGAVNTLAYLSGGQPSLLPNKEGRSIQFSCPMATGSPATTCGRIPVPGFNRAGTNGWTLEFWVKVTFNMLQVTTGSYALFEDTLSSVIHSQILYNFNNQEWRFNKNPTVLTYAPMKNWGNRAVHMAVVFDRTNLLLRVFANGNQVASTATTNVITGSTNPFYIGHGLQTTFPAVQAYLDEIAWYTFPLSAARIRKHYETGRSQTMTLTHTVSLSMSMSQSLTGSFTAGSATVSLTQSDSAPSGTLSGSQSYSLSQSLSGSMTSSASLTPTLTPLRTRTTTQTISLSQSFSWTLTDTLSGTMSRSMTMTKSGLSPSSSLSKSFSEERTRTESDTITPPPTGTVTQTVSVSLSQSMTVGSMTASVTATLSGSASASLPFYCGGQTIEHCSIFHDTCNITDDGACYHRNCSSFNSSQALCMLMGCAWNRFTKCRKPPECRDVTSVEECQTLISCRWQVKTGTCVVDDTPCKDQETVSDCSLAGCAWNTQAVPVPCFKPILAPALCRTVTVKSVCLQQKCFWLDSVNQCESWAVTCQELPPSPSTCPFLPLCIYNAKSRMCDSLAGIDFDKLGYLAIVAAQVPSAQFPGAEFQISLIGSTLQKDVNSVKAIAAGATDCAKASPVNSTSKLSLYDFDRRANVVKVTIDTEGDYRFCISANSTMWLGPWPEESTDNVSVRVFPARIDSCSGSPTLPYVNSAFTLNIDGQFLDVTRGRYLLLPNATACPSAINDSFVSVLRGEGTGRAIGKGLLRGGTYTVCYANRGGQVVRCPNVI